MKINKSTLREHIRNILTESLTQMAEADVNRTMNEESAASKEAKRMGLEYMNAGRWGKNGEVTHNTVKGKLTPVDRSPGGSNAATRQGLYIDPDDPTRDPHPAFYKDPTVSRGVPGTKPVADYDPDKDKLVSKTASKNRKAQQKANADREKTGSPMGNQDPLIHKKFKRDFDSHVRKTQAAQTARHPADKAPQPRTQPESPFGRPPKDTGRVGQRPAERLTGALLKSMQNNNIRPGKDYSAQEFSEKVGLNPQQLAFLAQYQETLAQENPDYQPMIVQTGKDRFRYDDPAQQSLRGKRQAFDGSYQNDDPKDYDSYGDGAGDYDDKPIKMKDMIPNNDMDDMMGDMKPDYNKDDQFGNMAQSDDPTDIDREEEPDYDDYKHFGPDR